MISILISGSKIFVNRLITQRLHPYLFLRSGQAWVPARPPEPGNIPESLWSDRALLQHWGWRSISGPCRRSAAAAVSLPAVWDPNGRIPAIMPPKLQDHLTTGHLSYSLPSALVSPPLFPTHWPRDWSNHYEYEKCNITDHMCASVQHGSSSAILLTSLWRFHLSFCLALSSPLRLNPTYFTKPQQFVPVTPCPYYFFFFFNSSSSVYP